MDIEKYFIANTLATFENKYGRIQLVSADSDIRQNEAKNQYQKPQVPITTIVSYVNDFFNMICNDSKTKLEVVRIGGNNQIVVDRAIIVTGCEWQAPNWDQAKKRYTFWDRKYNIIQKYFDLRYPSDIVWMKFTEDGYLGVVADSFDINYSYDNSSGKLIRVLDKSKQWNKSVVVIFPITQDLLRVKNRKEIETGIGNYLEDRGVPIIDYYSHNNFNVD